MDISGTSAKYFDEVVSPRSEHGFRDVSIRASRGRGGMNDVAP